MRIRTKLAAITGAAAIVGLFALSTLAWTNAQLSRSAAELALIQELIETQFERAALREEYFLYHEERPREQWMQHTEHMTAALERANTVLGAPDQQDLLRRIRPSLEKTKVLFARLLETHEMTSRGSLDAAQGAVIEGLLRSQLILDAQQLAVQIFKLQAITNRERAARYSRSQALILTSFLALTGFALATLALVARSIVAPLRRLEQGIEVISTGDLAHRIGLVSNDEIGDVGRAFDAMTERLRSITVSRDELTKEVIKRREVEAALHKANEDLESSNKDLEQFAYVASHDLQEPLRMVASFTQLLAQRYEGQLDEKGRKYINYAVDGAVRMKRLIDDLLTYSRIASRAMPLQTIDANAVLEAALKNLAAAIEESRASITAGKLPTVRADAAQLTLVFQNLIGNAIKFRGPEEPRVHVAVADRAGEWIFSIRDNGIGIKPEHADRIFVIFQRLHTREEYPGTGIGLALCKQVVERHGGRIWVESEPGKGSTFFFSMPQ